MDMTSLVIRDARIIDPAAGRNDIGDIFIRDGRITVADSSRGPELNAGGWLVCPGLTDMHVHLREPGQSHKETIESGTAAAAAGGFTCVACMPNTQPAIDEPERVRWILERARAVGNCDVAPVAAVTRGREGREVTDFASLLQAGAVAFSDDGVGVESDEVMRRAFELAASLDALLIQHCEYRAISAGGVMHLGDFSRRIGMPGLDPRSEEAMIERDIDLCRKTGGRYHVAHISTARAVDLVRRARKEGLPVTAEVCTHHLILTDEACVTADPNTKMHPPLRPQTDVEACRRGLLDGTIDAIVTDHAPHAPEEKAQGFRNAPPGIVGLETAVGLSARAMVHSGLADWHQLIQWFTVGPDRLLRREHAASNMNVGLADLTLLDPALEWSVRPESFASKGRNTPFVGWKLIGGPVATVRGRRLLFHSEAFLNRLRDRA